MRIVVTPAGKKGKSRIYFIEVLDGTRSVHAESVEGTNKRDEVIWRLAELYNVLDISIKEEKEDFKFAEIPSIPVLEEGEADEFFEDNREFVYARVLQAVTEGLKAKQKSIRLFELNGTGVYLTSNRIDWKNGVQDALEYFLSVEQYDKCIIARQLMLKLASITL